MPQLYNDNVGEVLRKYSADSSVTVGPAESTVSATGVQLIVAGYNITIDPPDGQGIVTINAEGLLNPWVHFDVNSNANGLQFSNTAFDVYQYGNQLNVFRNGILIDPAKIVLVSANTIQINECLFAGDTVDILNQGVIDPLALTIQNTNVSLGKISTLNFINTTINKTGNTATVTVPVYSNSNVSAFLPGYLSSYTGNISANTITASANLNSTYIVANGYYLTGINASNILNNYSNSNVQAYLPTYAGNLVSLTGNVITTANVSGAYILGNGRALTGIIGGSNTQIQYNDAGQLSGIPNFTYLRNKETVTVKQIIENANITASPMPSTVTFNVLDTAILYYSANANVDSTLNIRGNSTTTLSTLLDTGQSITCTFVFDTGNPTFGVTTFQIDGNTIIPRWLGGAGNVNPSYFTANSTYAYTFTILKTGVSTFRTLATQSGYR